MTYYARHRRQVWWVLPDGRLLEAMPPEGGYVGRRRA